MTLFVLATAAAVVDSAFYTRIRYWRYIAVGASLGAVTFAGVGLITLAGAPNPLLLAGFVTTMLIVKAGALIRARQLTQREKARAAYRFATATCPTCGMTKDRAKPICAQCEWTLAAARAGTIVVSRPVPAQEAA